jgi:hypothetical protein
MTRALLLIASLVFSGAALAQYKWLDKNGKPQYGDAPPPGVNATPLRAPTAPRPQPEAAAKDDLKKAPLTTSEKEAEFRKRQQAAEKDRQKQAQAQEEAAAKKDDCARAQEYLRTLESGQRISRTDAKGERYFLEDAQMQQETARARQMAKQSCS